MWNLAVYLPQFSWVSGALGMCAGFHGCAPQCESFISADFNVDLACQLFHFVD